MSQTYTDFPDDRKDLIGFGDVLKIFGIVSVTGLFVAASLAVAGITVWNRIPTARTSTAAACALDYLKQDGLTHVTAIAERHSAFATGELWSNAGKLFVRINKNGVTIRPYPHFPETTAASVQIGIASAQIREECGLR